MKKIILFVFGAVLLSVTSCNNDDPDPQGYGDAFIMSKLQEADGDGEPTVVYGLYLATGAIYGTFSSVNVTAGTASYTLQKNTETGDFYYETTNYGTTLPEKGTYTFSYAFTSGDMATSANVLTEKVLAPANITASAFSNNKIELKWDKVTDASVIYVRLKDSQDKIVFSSSTSSAPYLAGDKTEYSISTAAGTWKSSYTPTNGATYTAEVIALLAENATSNYLQAQSVASTSVVWGQ